MTIPGADRLWKGNYESDIYGSFVAAKNISLDKKGYLRLAKKIMVMLNELDDSDFEVPVAIAADATYVYILTTSALIVVDVSTLVLTNYSSGGPSFGFQSDLVFFNSLPHVSGTTSVKSLVIGTATWTSRLTGLSSAVPHPMCVHAGRQTLLVADGNVVRQYDTAYVRDATNELTIPSDYIITRIIYRDNKAYILTRNIVGGRAALIVWGGTGVGNNGLYSVPGHWIYSGCEDESLIAIMLSTGQLLHFNGSGFQQLDCLPVYYTDYSWSSSAAQSSLIGNVASRGMESDGGEILIMLNGGLKNGQTSPAGQYLPNMPSGLWCFNKDSGLYPLAGVNYKKFNDLAPSEVNTSALVFSTAHQALTGDPVRCMSVGGLSEFSANQTYYAIVLSSTVLQLALSPAEAKEGNYIPITHAPTASDKFAFDTYDTFGSGEISNAGPVFVMKELIPDVFFGSRAFVAARTIDNNGTSFGMFGSLGMGRNQGYFITPKIASSSIEEAFQALALKYPRLNLESESFIVKYRTTDRFGVPTHTAFGGAASFTSSTTFTVNPANKDVQTLELKDEVEFISGAAAGYLAHITAIDKTNPVLWIFTVDETLPVVNGDTTDFVGMNWKKRDTFDTETRTNSQNYGKQAIGDKTTWVQFKIALRGSFGIGIEQLNLISSVNKPATA